MDISINMKQMTERVFSEMAKEAIKQVLKVDNLDWNSRDVVNEVIREEAERLFKEDTEIKTALRRALLSWFTKFDTAP